MLKYLRKRISKTQKPIAQRTDISFRNHGLKPVSRLTIVFILAVLLSGSVLAWFSINNISNLKELTEKRILEEQRVLSDRFLNTVSAMLEDVTEGLSTNDLSMVRLRENLERSADKNSFVIQPFIVRKDGQFIHPDFTGALVPAADAKPSGMFLSSFAAGETAEFAGQDPGKARRNYMSGLKYAAGKNDTVRALNSLGRIAVRMSDYENAIAHYSKIINDYPGVTDPNGMPYSFYALQQLIRIAEQYNISKTIPAVRLCLEKMTDGTIPLYHGTEELLGSIAGYLDRNDFDNPDDRVRIASLAAGLKAQTQFIRVYGDELKELVAKGNLNEFPSAGNGFIVADPVSGLPNEFFLVYAPGEIHPGFLIDSEELLDTVLTADLQSGLEFDYIIDFPASYSRSEAADNRLVNRSQLNPFLPGQLMVIKLSDETLINDIVMRRGLIYGIASVMLLVAMLLGVALILRDISREKHLARLRADFISNVTHELKTPLTSIRMYAESLILGRVKTAEEQKEYMEVVVHESDRLKRMINNILEFSKMEKGRPEYRFKCSDMHTVVNAAIDDMLHWFEQEEFKVTAELQENIFADIDPEKMKQALDNLFSNAIKYSSDTKEIFIRLFREHEHACIEVEDHGIGIAADKLSRIFEPFYRIGQKEGTSGTGLGLTVVREIIEAHKGSISVISDIGKGSKFIIRLPACDFRPEPDKNDTNGNQ